MCVFYKYNIVLLLYNICFNGIFCYSISIYNKLGSRTLVKKSCAHRESNGWWCQMKNLPGH